MEPGEKTISEIAALYGLSLRTLRFYEDCALLQPIRRGSSRYYTARDRYHLEIIIKGKRLRLTLSQIRNILKGASARSHKTEPDITALMSFDQIDTQMKELEAKRSRLQEAIDELKQRLA